MNIDGFFISIFQMAWEFKCDENRKYLVLIYSPLFVCQSPELNAPLAFFQFLNDDFLTV